MAHATRRAAFALLLIKVSDGRYAPPVFGAALQQSYSDVMMSEEGGSLHQFDENSSKTRAMEKAMRQDTSPTALINELPPNSLRACLISFMSKRAISTDALAELAALNRASLYKILNGSTKHPQRNVLIRLALVLRLSFDETQRLLHYGGCAPLSGNRARDIIISNGIIKESTIDDVNSHLQAHYFLDLYSKE